MKVSQSCLTLCDPKDYTVHGILQATVGNLSLLQRIFPTQRSNPVLLHCRQFLYELSHKGSPRILECVAFPYSRGSSQTRVQTCISCIGRCVLCTSTTWNLPLPLIPCCVSTLHLSSRLIIIFLQRNRVRQYDLVNI